MSQAEQSSRGFTPLRWFRLGTRDDEEGAPPARERDPTVAEVAREGRRELLEEISSFLLSNDLAINPANLATAWKAFSGAAPSLRRRIETRVHAGEKVSQRWLDELAISAQEQRQKEDLQRTMDALDASVTRFARTTTEARSATTAYSSALGEHVQQLGEIGNEADVVERLASLAEEMAERTRIAEAELKTSEREAKALRRRLDKARREAERDHLTGLPNRRAFEAELERQCTEAKAQGEPLCVAFCDVDHFKLINDQHGHDAGDRVLKVIAQALSQSSDDNCHVSRHGGEEFVLLFRGLSLQEAKAKLDETREELAARRLLNRETDRPFGQITFSGGVANIFAYDDPRAALKAADQALYKAKESGRNRVEIA